MTGYWPSCGQFTNGPSDRVVVTIGMTTHPQCGEFWNGAVVTYPPSPDNPYAR